VKRNVPHLIVIALLVIIDQATKALVAQYVPLFGSVSVIPGFFKIAPIRNKGAIFGIFSQVRATGLTSLLTAAQLVAFGLVIYYFLKTPAAQKITKIGLTLILAGAVGNLIDRLARGYVLDFIEWHVKQFYWPTFNVADSCITIGALVLAAAILLRRS
jgi:signal peptidase II